MAARTFSARANFAIAKLMAEEPPMTRIGWLEMEGILMSQKRGLKVRVLFFQRTRKMIER